MEERFQKLSTFSSMLADAFVEANGQDVPIVISDPANDTHFIQSITYDPQYNVIRINVSYDRHGLNAYSTQLKMAT